MANRRGGEQEARGLGSATFIWSAGHEPNGKRAGQTPGEAAIGISLASCLKWGYMSSETGEGTGRSSSH